MGDADTKAYKLFHSSHEAKSRLLRLLSANSVGLMGGARVYGTSRSGCAVVYKPLCGGLRRCNIGGRWTAICYGSQTVAAPNKTVGKSRVDMGNDTRRFPSRFRIPTALDPLNILPVKRGRAVWGS